MPTLIYSYGALKPVTNLAKVDEQLLLAHRYRNKLVELELARRQAVQAAVTQHFPEYAQAQTAADLAGKAVEAECDKIRAANAAARQRTQTPEQRSQIKALSKQATELRKRARELKQLAFAKSEIDGKKVFAHAAFQAAMDTISTADIVARKKARAESGLYFGTYLEVEDAAKKMRVGLPPRFKRYEGEGKSSVQISGGLKVEDLAAGEHTQLRMYNPKTKTYGPPENARPNETHWVDIHYRVCSENRQPVWAVVPVNFQRPFPPGSVIKRAWLLRRRIGPNYKYKFQFVIDTPATPRPENAKGTIAFNVNWRKVNNGIRVAVWKDSNGDTGEYVIPESIIERWKYPRIIQSYRDLNLEPNMRLLRAWLKGDTDSAALQQLYEFWAGRLERTHVKARENARAVTQAIGGLMAAAGTKITQPDWLKERTATIGQWKDGARLAALVIHWRNNRFAGDEYIYTILEMWRRQDKHLWVWSAQQTAQVIRWRNWQYTKFAHDIAQKYEKAAVGDVNFADMQKGKGPANETAADAALTVYRALAAPGKFVECLSLALPTIKLPAQNITKECNACGNVEDFDAAKTIHHACSKCGAVWDQDKNAAENIMRAALC